MKSTKAQDDAGAEYPAARGLRADRKEARDQLTLVLSFFSRVDAKASALLAIDTGMLAVLTSKAPPVTTISTVSYILAGVTAVTLAGSLFFLYRVAFPALKGEPSLIYFRTIAGMPETDFIDAFAAEEEDSRVKDLLGQVWRNSCILTAKFDALKRAFILMALAVIPWGATVALFSSQHTVIQTISTK
jgi:hypothetical protein